MSMKSPAFRTGELIPKKYTCDGENINPPLELGNFPEGAKSFVLVVGDPDAPAGTWIHWTLWNMPPAVSFIEEAKIPPGAIEGITSFGRPGYGGPCPPSGTHRYFFKIYAIDTRLEIPAESTINDLEKAMEGHIIGKGELMGRYGK